VTDPLPPPASSDDPLQPVAEAAVTRVVNVGRGKSSAGGSSLAPIRPSALLSARRHRPTMAGRFVLTGEIARGGMGVVYRGHDPDLGRELAIKVLKPERVEDADLVAMFFNEARVCGQLQHPGIVPIHELGSMADGSPFIAMKLVEGKTFARLLADRRRSAHDLQQILRIFEAVCQTLAYAHSRGVVHRDLKPSNIMVGPFNEVQVVDWGLACEVASREGDRAGGTPSNGSVMGTPAYMAPEQARGGTPLDVRLDVFALGAILCEILTGAPPFPEGDGATIDRVCNGETQPALDRLREQGLDADLVDLACRCLSVDPARRPGDAGLVALALRDHEFGVQERLRQAELQQAAAGRDSWRLLLALAVAVAGLLGFLVGWIVREKMPRAGPATPAIRSGRPAEEAHEIEVAPRGHGDPR
jgi:serine/threonine protein kinase